MITKTGLILETSTFDFNGKKAKNNVNKKASRKEKQKIMQKKASQKK